MKEIIIPAARRIETKNEDLIVFELPPFVRPLYKQMIKELNEKGIKFNKLKIAPPHKPRTTGPYSQNHHFNGHVAQICRHPLISEDFETVKFWIKKRAIKRDLPFHTTPDGDVVPISEADMSTTECAMCIEECHQVADEMEIILIEE